MAIFSIFSDSKALKSAIDIIMRTVEFVVFLGMFVIILSCDVSIYGYPITNRFLAIIPLFSAFTIFVLAVEKQYLLTLAEIVKKHGNFILWAIIFYVIASIFTCTYILPDPITSSLLGILFILQFFPILEFLVTSKMLKRP